MSEQSNKIWQTKFLKKILDDDEPAKRAKGREIMFKPKAIYFEKEIENYELGKQLLEKYKEVPKVEIENHNNIEEMRKKQNK